MVKYKRKRLKGVGTIFGSTFKKVRQSKNLSQKQVAKDCIHQTSYSKFELNNISVSIDIFLELLKNVDLSPTEFLYIHNGYQHSKHEKIIQSFFNMTFINVPLLEEIVAELENDYEDNQLLKDIYHLSKGLITIKKTGSFEESFMYANGVWNRLQKYDSWYLSDIFLINNILFLFPLKTAVSISNFAINQLQKYLDYDSKIKLLVNTIQFNVVHLLIRDHQFKEAFHLNEKVIASFKEIKRYYHIAISELRHQMLLKKIDPQKYSHNKVEKLFVLAEILEDTNLTNHLTEEMNYLQELLK